VRVAFDKAPYGRLLSSTAFVVLNPDLTFYRSNWAKGAAAKERTRCWQARGAGPDQLAGTKPSPVHFLHGGMWPCALLASCPTFLKYPLQVRFLAHSRNRSLTSACIVILFKHTYPIRDLPCCRLIRGRHARRPRLQRSHTKLGPGAGSSHRSSCISSRKMVGTALTPLPHALHTVMHYIQRSDDSIIIL
jgi:hypothetical protein